MGADRNKPSMGLKSLSRVIQTCETWFNLNPAPFQPGDLLFLRRDESDDVVVVFRKVSKF